MATTLKSAGPHAATREHIFNAFRRWGYLQADLDPLGHLQPAPVADLDELAGPDAEAARRTWCSSIGIEFMHIPDPEPRRWIAERMENADAVAALDRERLLHRLVEAE